MVMPMDRETRLKRVLDAIPGFAHDVCLVVNHVRADANYDYAMHGGSEPNPNRAIAMRAVSPDYVLDPPAIERLVRWVLFVEKEGAVREAALRLYRAFYPSEIH
jgi:hypothetical protein